jgi:IS5 family transposase
VFIGHRISEKMRHRFQQQTTFGITPISEVKFPLRSRDELPPVLMALQHMFITPELNEKVFALLEKKIVHGKKKTGRKGMDLWHILVLAVIRHTLDTNWDRLENLANYHKLLRQILGIHVEKFGIEEIEFAYQTMVDNVSLIDDELLHEINLLVVEHGHNLLKKKDEEISLSLKTDSYVLETNVHFPTDLNLLWDSLRKGLDMVEKLMEKSDVKGWRKIKRLRSATKSMFRQASQQVFRSNGKNEKQKQEAVKNYLKQSNMLQQRFNELIQTPPVGLNIKMIVSLILCLKSCTDYARKFTDQIERRLLKKEAIPASEKIYSIFEEHTEWITKGKLNKKVELGHLLLITTDQYQLIVDYKIMEGQKDAAQIEPLKQRIQHNYAGKKISSHSFDKGFYSKINLDTLQQDYTTQAVLPKRGRYSKEDKERESSKSFKQLRRAHSAVESNINMLEHHGLNRCVDKGLHGYKRNVGLSVLAYNLHIIGNHLIAREKQKEEKRLQDRLNYRGKKQAALSLAA